MQVIAAVGHACIGQARDHCQVVLQRKALVISISSLSMGAATCNRLGLYALWSL